MTTPKQKGFSLIEMVVVLGIFSMMTAIVVFNYNKFTSDTILTNMAYEVALSLREAQIYGVSVRNPSGASASADFSTPYGVHFPYVSGGSSNYVLFADGASVSTLPGSLDGKYQSGDDNCPALTYGECVSVYGLQRGIKIVELHRKTGSSCQPRTSSEGLSVTFRRPDPEAIFDGEYAVSYAQITLMAPNGSRRYVVVSNNGQIYVSPDPLSGCLAGM